MDRDLAVVQSAVYSRRRRQVFNPEHVSMLSAQFSTANDTSVTTPNTSNVEVLHDSYNTSSEHDNITVSSLHDVTTAINVDNNLLKNVSVSANHSITNVSATTAQDAEISTEAYSTTQFVTNVSNTQSTSDPSLFESESFQESSSTDMPTAIPTNTSDLAINASTIAFDVSTKSYDETMKEKSTDTVLKVTEKEIKLSELKVDPIESKLPESNSMKPSAVESPEVIQHDYPIYSYGQDEVEIVHLDKGSNGTLKKKSPDANQLNNEVKDFEEKVENKTVVEESSEELQTFNLAPVKKLFEDETKKKANNMHESEPAIVSNNNQSVPSVYSPQVQLVDIPESNRHSKRVLVNVTIATQPDSNYPFASNPVYVLSVSVPTDGNPNSVPGINIGYPNSPEPMAFQMSTQNPYSTSFHPSSTITPVNHPPISSWGGECECSCPCLEESSSVSEDNESSTADTLTNSSKELTPLALNASSPTNSSYVDDVAMWSESENNTEYFSSDSEAWSDDPLSSANSSFSTEVSSTETSSGGCLEGTTPLPPLPTILILEGRII